MLLFGGTDEHANGTDRETSKVFAMVQAEKVLVEKAVSSTDHSEHRLFAFKSTILWAMGTILIEKRGNRRIPLRGGIIEVPAAKITER